MQDVRIEDGDDAAQIVQKARDNDVVEVQKAVEDNAEEINLPDYLSPLQTYD